MLPRIFLFLLFIFIAQYACAQDTTSLRLLFDFSATDSLTFKQTAPPPPLSCPTPDACRATLSNFIQQIRNNGYFAASIDSLIFDKSSVRVVLHLGTRYQTVWIDLSNIEPRLLSQVGFNSKLYPKRAIDFEKLRILQEKIIRHLENGGYPFAQTRLDSVVWNGQNQLQAKLMLQKNRRMTIDSIALPAEKPIARRYLHQYLNLRRGQAYSELDLQKANIRLRELPFLTQTEAPQVMFIEDKARIFLFLKKKKASRFDFLLGVLPEPLATATNGKQRFQISGEGTLNLINAIGAGETMDLQFKSYPQKARELKLRLLYPYIPLLPVGADTRFELYLRDTLFRDVQAYIGVQYLLRGNNYWKGFFRTKSSDILSVDSARIVQTRQLPAILDTRGQLYGIEYNTEQLDYRLNPRRGFELNINVAVGRRTIKSNNAIIALSEPAGISFAEKYDSLNTKTSYYQVGLLLNKYWQLGKRSTLKTALRGALIDAANLYDNDLYRIGGSRLLRGFDEETILATRYAVFTVEYRFLIGQNAYLSAFYDAAYIANTRINNADTENYDFPMGIGAGMNFETKAGVFGFSYALGRQQGQPFDMRGGKVHLGYINYF